MKDTLIGLAIVGALFAVLLILPTDWAIRKNDAWHGPPRHAISKSIRDWGKSLRRDHR